MESAIEQARSNNAYMPCVVFTVGEQHGYIRRLAKGADLSNNTAPKWVSWKAVDSKGDPP
jgi:hypothetical protein